jgi:hypothetical protein
MGLARPSRPRVVGFTALLALLAAAEARATCMEMVQLRPILPDCTVLKEAQGSGPATIEVWPESQPLAVAVEVGGCCSPPGGPVHCSYRPVEAADAANFSLTQWGPQSAPQPVAGAFRVEPLACLGKPVLIFERPVPAGIYGVQSSHGGGSRVEIVDDARAARATKVSGLPATQADPTGEATPTGETAEVAATPNPRGCALGGTTGPSALLVLASLVRRRRRG